MSKEKQIKLQAPVAILAEAIKCESEQAAKLFNNKGNECYL